MDLQRKTIQDLTGSLDERKVALSALYRTFGEVLLSGSLDPEGPAGVVSPEREELYRSLRGSREIDTAAIIEIKDAVQRLQELTAFRKELERSKTREQTGFSSLLEEFGKLCYARFTEADPLGFAQAFESAAKEEKSLLDYRQKADELTRDAQRSNFIGKIMIRIKLGKVQLAIRNHSDNLSEILIDGARSVAQGSAAAALYEQGQLEAELVPLWEKISDSLRIQAETDRRVFTCDADIERVRAILISQAAIDNPPRRIDEIKQRIHDTDKRIEALAMRTSREYSDKFLDDEGISLLGEKNENAFSSMGVYASYLEQVAAIRSTIHLVRRQIESLETSIRIDTLSRSISGWEKDIDDNLRKIAQLQKSNSALDQRLSDARKEQDNLLEKKRRIDESLKKD